MKYKTKDKAVILCNLGGPRNLDEVETFLLDLLGDPNVIQLPWFLKWFQKVLAKIIVKKRLPFSKKLYQDIGGKSPLVEITQIQAELLEQKIGLKTFIFMNCGKPNAEDLKLRINEFNPNLDSVAVVPLFPQYSTTTSKTSIEKIECFVNEFFPDTKLNIVESFATHPLFIQAWQQRIKAKIKHINEPFQLFFSAHGIPQSYVDKGDPYSSEVTASVDGIMKAFPGQKYTICFQSRFGKGQWLEPYTDKLIEEASPGTKIVVVPISFVSDHVETIHEIGIEFKELAEERNVDLLRVPGLNNSNIFIDCLAALVEEKLKTL
ncbi:MAG: ferrochelatase [Candidatus Caenarcaniphilales bacterium]|nr:ferrochelatase [Candidatus Caenarcaniphilales bacterium]